MKNFIFVIVTSFDEIHQIQLEFISVHYCKLDEVNPTYFIQLALIL